MRTLCPCVCSRVCSCACVCCYAYADGVQALALVSPPIDEVPPPMVPSRGDFARWPVILAAGEEDEYCSASQLRAIAGGSATTLVVLEGVSHFLHGDTAQQMGSHIAEWIGSLAF